MNHLQELRNQVDLCDRTLATLLEERLSIVLEIMKEKKSLGMPIFSPDRERVVIQNMGTYVNHPEFREEIKTIHSHILRSCRKIQSKILFPYHITLVGFMGSGKTTIGKALSKLLDMDQIDVDRVIEERTRMKISEIFAKYGEPYFRALESKTVQEMTQYQNVIIFCSGGGIVLNENNVDCLKQNGVVIWLKASPEVIYNRIASDDSRPLLKDDMSVNKIETLLDPRLALYESAADISIVTDHKSEEDICMEIIDQLMHLELKREAPKRRVSNL
jgi:shikimate kinase